MEELSQKIERIEKFLAEYHGRKVDPLEEEWESIKKIFGCKDHHVLKEDNSIRTMTTEKLYEIKGYCELPIGYVFQRIPEDCMRRHEYKYWKMIDVKPFVKCTLDAFCPHIDKIMY